MFIYQFATHAGAVSYEALGHAEMSKPTGGVTPQPFAVSGIPGAHGLHTTTSDGSVVHIVSFAKGPYAVQIVTNAKSAAADVTPTAVQLAAQQYAKL